MSDDSRRAYWWITAIVGGISGLLAGPLTYGRPLVGSLARATVVGACVGLVSMLAVRLLGPKLPDRDKRSHRRDRNALGVVALAWSMLLVQAAVSPGHDRLDTADAVCVAFGEVVWIALFLRERMLLARIRDRD